MAKDQAMDQLKDKALEQLLSMPQVVVALFFMWLCGFVFNGLIFRTNPGFTKYKTVFQSKWFTLAIGFAPCAIVMIVYHLVVYERFLTSLDDLSLVALPSSIILGGLTFILILWKGLAK